MALIVAVVALPPAAGAGAGAGLEVVGRHDLGGGGGHLGVAVIGSTAIVVSDSGPCTGATATLVDVGNPRRPRLTGTTPLAVGEITGLAAGGGLVAAAGPTCPRPGGAVAYLRTTGPAVATRTGEGTAPAVALAPGADGAAGRARAAVAWAPSGLVEVVDLTDPSDPQPVATWSAPGGPPVDVDLYDRGRRLVVLGGDGRLLDLDLDLDVPGAPAPVVAGDVDTGAGGASHVTVSPLAARTVAVVSAPDGLRIVDLDAAGGAQATQLVRSASAAAPGKVVVSGDYAFVPWHGDGLRVLDLGGPHPATLAEFDPDGDIVGVALLPDHVLALDRSAGLYVLERPGEGGGGSSDRDVLFLAGVALAGLILLLAVPRVATALSASAQSSPARQAAAARARPRARPGRKRGTTP